MEKLGGTCGRSTIGPASVPSLVQVDGGNVHTLSAAHSTLPERLYVLPPAMGKQFVLLSLTREPKMKRKELEERRLKLIADIRSQGDAYEARKKKGENPWPDETRKAWDAVNAEFDSVEKEIKELGRR